MIFTLQYSGVNVIENAPFKIERPDGSFRHIFFHFTSQVIIKIKNQDIVCTPGTCILFEPGVYQHFYVESNRLNHDYMDFILDEPTFFNDINFPLNTPFNIKDSKTINEMIHKIIGEKENTNIGTNYITQALMIELFIHIARKYHYKKTYSNDKYQNIQKNQFESVRLSIYQSPDELKISNIAKEMGFSISRFNELYKRYFNTTPLQDLTQSRISRVEELIKDGYSTKEIIKIIGFSSDEYFYRWFKKHFKSTKKEFINDIKSK